MDLPPVFDVNGDPILPSQYKNVIPEGTLVAICGSMKM